MIKQLLADYNFPLPHLCFPTTPVVSLWRAQDSWEPSIWECQPSHVAAEPGSISIYHKLSVQALIWAVPILSAQHFHRTSRNTVILRFLHFCQFKRMLASKSLTGTVQSQKPFIHRKALKNRFQRYFLSQWGTPPHSSWRMCKLKIACFWWKYLVRTKPEANIMFDGALMS